MRRFGIVLAAALLSVSAKADPLADPLADLGKILFFSSELSVNGTQSCGSCHDPKAGFTASDPAANLGGGVMEGAIPGLFGNRKPPSIAYGSLAPVFHHDMREVEILGEMQEELTFVGGAFWDGRARGHVTGTALADQALAPFVNPLEMAMPHKGCVVLRACQMAGGLSDKAMCDLVAGAGIDEKCRDPLAKIVMFGPARGAAETGVVEIARAIAAFERSPEVVRFSSRFDDWQAGRGTLSDQERAGLDLFSAGANCSFCHAVTPNAEGGPPLFTDFTFSNIGLPRNAQNPYYDQDSNAEGQDWVDAGLSAVLERDAVYKKYALGQKGSFKVPTLRNLDAKPGPDGTRSYGHNGYFKTIEGIVHFYNTRDALPRCASNLATEAEALAQNCWPAPEIASNVNTVKIGDLRLTAQQEADVVAFLKTLTDR